MTLSIDSPSGLISSAARDSDVAIAISPRNLNIKKSRANVFLLLSEIDSSYMSEVIATLEEISTLAPTDAKIFYNLGLSFGQANDSQNAIKNLQKAVELKGDFRNARFALALFYIEAGQNDRAKKELLYILEKIDPKDPLATQKLQEL